MPWERMWWNFYKTWGILFIYSQQPVDKYIIPVLTSEGGYSSTCFPCLLLEAFSILFTLIKPCYTKLWVTESVFGPGVKFSPSETTNPVTLFTENHKLSVVWTFFGIALLWDWNENRPFPVLWPLLSFSNLLTYLVQHFNSIVFKDY